MPASKTRERKFDEALDTARRTIYRFLGLCLVDPRTGSWEALRDPHSHALVEEAAALVRAEESARPESLGPGERGLEELDPAPVFGRLPQSAGELNALYEHTFGLVVSGACPPHETDYVDPKLVFRRSHELADISGFYLAFGLEPSRSSPERPDHIVLELEFMAFLLAHERRAFRSRDPDRHDDTQTCRDAQRRFLREHLAWWTPAFARLLEREDPDGFYGATARFLSASIPAERGFLSVAPAGITPVPNLSEGPEECSACSLRE